METAVEIVAVETLESAIARTAASVRAVRAKQLVKLSRTGRAAFASADEKPFPTLDDNLALKKKAPTTTTIAVVPTDPSDADLESLHNIRLLEAYISAAASAFMFNNNPNGWNLEDPGQAADFIRKSADAQFRVITEGLPSILNFGPQVAQSFSKSTTSADLHLDFLSGLFGGFGFAPQAMQELDGILTKVTANLAALQASFSDQSQTLNHLVTFHYPEPVLNSSTLNDWKLRLFYLQVDQNSWTVSVGKSSVTHLEFKMNYFDLTSNLNDEQLVRNRDTIQAFIDTLTTQGFSAIEKLTTPLAIVSDATLKK